jgi:hypothetical protein
MTDTSVKILGTSLTSGSAENPENIASTYVNNSKAALTGKSSEIFTSGLTSWDSDIRKSFEAVVKTYPLNEQADVVKKGVDKTLTNSVFDRFARENNGEIRIENIPGGDVGVHINNTVNWINDTLSADGMKKLTNVAKGRGAIANAFRDVISLVIGKDRLEEGSIASQQVMAQETKYLKDGLGPILTPIFSTVQSIGDKAITENADNALKINLGIFTSDLKGFKNPWSFDIKTVSPDGKTQDGGTTARFMFRNYKELEPKYNEMMKASGTARRGSDNKWHFPGGKEADARSIEKAAAFRKHMTDLSKNDPDAAAMLEFNVVQIGKALANKINSKVYKTKGNVKADILDGETIKVQLMDLSTMKTEVVEMTVGQAAIFAAAATQPMYNK